MRIAYSCGLFAMALLCGLGASAQAPDLSQLDVVEQAIPDGPVAMVDGKPLSRDDFLFLYRGQVHIAGLQSNGAALTNDDRVKIALHCMGELIQREILLQEAARRKLSVSDAEVEKAFADKIANLQKRMEKAGKSMTEEEFLKNIKQTKAEALAEIRTSLVVAKVYDLIASEKGNAIPDADVKQFYSSHPELFQQPSGMHLKQIFIKPKSGGNKADEAEWAEAEKRMKKALARIRAGESFEGVAKAMSEAPDAPEGGDMGMMPAAQLPPFFLEAIATMDKEDISGIIRSEHGFHLIKLLEKQDSQEVPLDKAKERIRELLQEVKTEDNVSQFCQPILNDESRVQVFLHIESALASMMEKMDKGAGS